MRASLALALILAGPALADTAMSAPEFERYSTGRTLSYAYGGSIFGTEQYLPGRRVIWAFAGEECRSGSWYPQDGDICFVYDDDGTPQCWQFFQGPGGLRAQFMDDPDGSELSEVAQTPDPLSCPGPDVGV